MPTTTTDGIPIPAMTDKADVPGDIKRAVDAIMAKIKSVTGGNSADWRDVPLAAGRSQNASYPLQWRRMNGVVELEGMVNSDYPGMIGVLPDGARPSKPVWFHFVTAGRSGTTGMGLIGPDGAIQFASGYELGPGGFNAYAISATFLAAS